MGDENSSFDWLPAGWKVELRIRKNGKKDRRYIDPSNERKFYSKLEVLRYLENAGTDHPVSEERKRKCFTNHSGKKFVVKEAFAEGLPAGWIKEIRVTKNGKKTRRDAYYVDPVSGHIFRSMKEVFLYLDTGKIKRRMCKPKDKDTNKRELRYRSLPSPAETRQLRPANSKAQKLVTKNQSQNSAVEAPAMNTVNLPKMDYSKQIEKKEKSSECNSPVVQHIHEKVQTENGVERHENTERKKKKKLRDKTGVDLPRRTSKRLAGIEVDLPLEIKSHNRVRQAALKPIDGEAKCVDSEALNNSIEEVKRVKTGNDEKKREGLDILPPVDVVFQEETTKQGFAECNGAEKDELLGSSFKELWKDPCIEFAIKTLTGELPIGDEDKIAKNPGSSMELPDAVIDSCQDMPLGDVWADPCFEFAVKTLTGDIPTVNDAQIQTVFQQSHSSSETGGLNGLVLPNFSPAAEFNQANHLLRHSDVSKIP